MFGKIERDTEKIEGWEGGKREFTKSFKSHFQLTLILYL